jgi:HJR/Mrr/RecB family endonuclease
MANIQSDLVQAIIGANESIKVLVLNRDIDFILRFEDFLLVSDQRLQLNMIIGGCGERQSILLNDNKIIKKILKHGWKINEVRSFYTANLFIVDDAFVFLFRKDGNDYFVEYIYNEQLANEIVYIFDILYEGKNETLIFEDIFNSSFIKNSNKIVTISTKIWSETHIRELAENPSELEKLNPIEFEKLIAELLVRKGMEVQVTRPSKDGGFDIIAKAATEFGQHLYLVECKHYTKTHKVGVSIIRALYGVVEHENATKGIIVTTSDFTKGAKEFENIHKNRLDLKNHNAVMCWLREQMHS